MADFYRRGVRLLTGGVTAAGPQVQPEGGIQETHDLMVRRNKTPRWIRLPNGQIVEHPAAELWRRHDEAFGSAGSPEPAAPTGPTEFDEDLPPSYGGGATAAPVGPITPRIRADVPSATLARIRMMLEQEQAGLPELAEDEGPGMYRLGGQLRGPSKAQRILTPLLMALGAPTLGHQAIETLGERVIYGPYSRAMAQAGAARQERARRLGEWSKFAELERQQKQAEATLQHYQTIEELNRLHAQGKPTEPTSVQEYKYYVEQEKQAGRSPMSFADWQSSKQREPSKTAVVAGYEFYVEQEKQAGRKPMSFADWVKEGSRPAHVSVEPGSYMPLVNDQGQVVGAWNPKSGQVSSVPSGFGPVRRSADPVQQAAQKKIQEAEATFNSADEMLNTIESLADKVITAEQAPFGVGAQVAKKGIGALLRTDPDAKVFLDTQKAFSSMLTRAAGEKGVLTNQDVQRIINALPGLGDTRTIAQRKMSQLRRLYESIKTGTRKAYSGGAGGPAAGPAAVPGQRPPLSSFERK